MARLSWRWIPILEWKVRAWCAVPNLETRLAFGDALPRTAQHDIRSIYVIKTP